MSNVSDYIPNLFDPNEKQQYLPFVIDPNQTINSGKVGINDDGTGAPPQLFSFRGQTYVKDKGYKVDYAQLAVVPHSYRKYVDKDISMRLLYQNDMTDTLTKNSIKFDDLLNVIPGVQIREFLPDSKLDQVINFVNNVLNCLGDTVKDLLKKGEYKDAVQTAAKAVEQKAQSAAQTIEQALSSMPDFAPWIGEYIFSETKQHGYYPAGESLWKDLIDVGKYEYPFYHGEGDSAKPFGKMKSLMLALPYQIYFKLQSCTTTNIYEIPFNNESKQMYSSNGSPGWDGSSGFAASIVDAAKSMLGSILPNINIQWSPWYNSFSGEKTPEDGLVISFDLFNDTAANAMNNFIFVNTIIPQNRWIQYGLFQHSPCLYDVKIEGIKRLYMCTGEFKVTQGGVLRIPPKTWIDTLIKSHANRCVVNGNFKDVEKAAKDAQTAKDSYEGSPEFYMDADPNNDSTYNAENVEKKQAMLDADAKQTSAALNEFTKRIDYIIQNNTIKIPDVYHVELAFKSLLPANFNTFILNYAENDNHIQTYAETCRDKSVIMDKLGDVMNKLKSKIDAAANNAATVAETEQQSLTDRDKAMANMELSENYYAEMEEDFKKKNPSK